MLEHRGDVHHIFPKNFLKTEHSLSRSDYNQVANYVYVQQEINIAIGDKRPSQYLGSIKDQCYRKNPIFGNIIDIEDLRKNPIESCVPLSLL